MKNKPIMITKIYPEDKTLDIVNKRNSRHKPKHAAPGFKEALVDAIGKLKRR